MVEISVGWSGKFESSEADVIKSFVVNTVSFVGVFYELVNRQGGVVRLHDGVGHLGGRDDGVGVHDSVGVLLPDLGNEKSSHSGSSSSSQGMGQLESLK